MAKAKKELTGNWELVSGGVFHKSWTGVTFRSRGSAGAYFEGCTFPRPPEQPPPPPPPPPISYVVRFRTRVVGYLRFFSAYAEKFEGDQRVAYGTAPEASIPAAYTFTRWEVNLLEYSADSLVKVYRFYFRPPGQPERWGQVVFQDNWNSLPDPGGNLLDEEVIFV